MEYSHNAIVRYLAPGAAHLIIYHILTEGRAFLRLESGERIALSAGDLVMIPRVIRTSWTMEQRHRCRI